MGHLKGDRKCKLSGWDPFSSNSFCRPAAAAAASTASILFVPESSALFTKPSWSIMPDRKQDGDLSDNREGTRRRRRSSDEWDRDSDSEDSRERRRQRRKQKERKRQNESRREQ